MTSLGEELLLGGEESIRKTTVKKKVKEIDMYQVILDNSSYLFYEETEGFACKDTSILGEKVFCFKVKVYEYKRVWCRLETEGKTTLADLHMQIIDAFSLSDEQLYSFYMSNRLWDPYSEYSHQFADGKPANKVRITDLGLVVKQKFCYLHNYGNENRFEVELIDISEKEEGVVYPRQTKGSKRFKDQARRDDCGEVY